MVHSRHKRPLIPALQLLITMMVWQSTPLYASSCPKLPDGICNTSFRTTKCFPIRSQSRHKNRLMVGSSRFIHYTDDTPATFSLSSTSTYSRSFRERDILTCFFGDDLSKKVDTTQSSQLSRSIHIQGSAITNAQSRDSKAWLADYFYLPRDFDATVSFDPRITTYTGDYDIYINLQSCIPGMYVRFHIPLVHTHWDLNMCESVSLNADSAPSETLNEYPQGYFTSQRIRKPQLLKTFTDYMLGGTPTLIPDPNNPVLNIEDLFTFQPLSFARMSPFVCKETQIADFRVEFGWNILACNDHHIGLNIQGAAPTGPRKNPCYLFSPIVGNGHHWELGAGITSHYVLYRSQDESCSCAFHADLNVTHLFKTRQLRTFDLKKKPNSAYMLAAKFAPNDDVKFPQIGSLIVPDEFGPPVPSHIFDLQYAPVANLRMREAQRE